MSLRILPCFFAALPAIALAFTAWGQEGPDKRDDREPQATAEQSIAKALDKQGSFDFQEVRLDDVAEFIEKAIGHDVVLDQRALDGAGIGSDEPITFQAGGISFRSALKLMLRDLALTWIIRNGALTITTPEEAEYDLETRVYLAGDLIEAAETNPFPWWMQQPGGLGGRSPVGGLSPRSVLGQFGGGSSGGLGGWVVDISRIDRPQDLAARRMHAEDLISLLVSAIAPESWDDVGGPGSIGSFGRLLIISQTREVHEEVAALLENLRQANRAVEKSGGQMIFSGGEGTAAEQALRRALASRTSLSVVETPLSDVMDALARQHKINIVLDRRALGDVGVPADTPITASIINASLEQTLRRALRDLDLTFVVRDEVLLITTPQESEWRLTTKVYRVDSLAANNDASDQLMDVVTATVAPDSWDVVGGPGAIQPAAELGLLVVSQSQVVHAEIALLLDDLRAKAADAEEAAAAPAAEGEAGNMRLIVYHLAVGADGLPIADPKETAGIIREVVAPDSWEKDGAYIRGIGNTLIIRQTAEVHRKIAILLEATGAVAYGGSQGGLFE